MTLLKELIKLAIPMILLIWGITLINKLILYGV